MQMKEADLFWLCWNTGMTHLWDGSNSHKILEYLSTGKPVVSHYVSSYTDTGLLYMLNQKSNAGFEELFKQIKGLVKEGEAKENIENRLKFAVQNSYENNVHKIAELINHA
jgi:glycosyltransferase involved in cell wall biosynthesis